MASTILLRTNFILLIVLVILLSHPEWASAETELSLKGFMGENPQQMKNDLGGISKRQETRFLGDTPGAVFVNVISIISGIFTIWGWIETREKKGKKDEEPEIDELLEEWNSQLEDINSQMEDFKNSMIQLVCRFDYVHTKSKTISRECSQFIQHEHKNYHPKTNATPPPVKLPNYHYKRNNVEKKSTLLETTNLDSLQRLLKATGDKFNESH